MIMKNMVMMTLLMMSVMMENMTMTMTMNNVDDDDIFQKPPWGERVPEESEG